MAPSTSPENAPLARTRGRSVRRFAFAIATALLLTLGVAVLAAFAWPRDAVADSIELRVGNLEDFAPGTVSSRLIPAAEVRQHRHPAPRRLRAIHPVAESGGRCISIFEASDRSARFATMP